MNFLYKKNKYIFEKYFKHNNKIKSQKVLHTLELKSRDLALSKWVFPTSFFTHEKITRKWKNYFLKIEPIFYKKKALYLKILSRSFFPIKYTYTEIKNKKYNLKISIS